MLRAGGVSKRASCEISELHHICDFFASPGMLSEVVTMDCGIPDATNAGGLHSLEHEDEDIEATAVPCLNFSMTSMQRNVSIPRSCSV